MYINTDNPFVQEGDIQCHPYDNAETDATFALMMAEEKAYEEAATRKRNRGTAEEAKGSKRSSNSVKKSRRKQ